MPFVKNNPKKEKARLKKLIETSSDAKKAAEEFDKVYEFRRSLILARRSRKLTQKQLGEITGLTQQSISRIETGSYNTTIENLIKYINGIGYDLKIHQLY